MVGAATREVVAVHAGSIGAAYEVRTGAAGEGRTGVADGMVPWV